MAQNLVLNVLARDKTKQAFNSVRAGLTNLKASIFSVQSALVGIGGGLVVRSILKVGSEVENLGIRFNFLFGNVKEGQKAFKGLIDFAGKVPFSLDEISSASGSLAVVSKDANELQKILKITGNVASVTGLDFRTTAEQIQRSFSAGIGSADLFREKGVRNMLGFQAGATVSIEETVKAFEKVFGKGGRFGSATDELANTFEGTLSMIGDKIFNFKKVLLEAGFFEELKKQFGDLDEFLENNSKKIDDIATSVGKNLANAVVGAVNLGKDLIPFLSKVKDQLIGLKETFDTLPAVMKQAGIIGALMLGKKGILGLGLILKAIEKADEFGEKYGDKPLVFPEILPFESELSIPIEQKAIKKVNEELEYTNMMMREFEHEMSVAIPSATQKALERFKDLNSGALEKLKNKTDDIRNIIIDTVDSGIKNMSRGLAVAFVTGNKLTDVFKNMARTLAINVLSALIEIVARKGVELAIEKLITAEKRKQMAYSSMGGGADLGGSLFGSIGKIFGFAKGGAVSKGQPIVVGEQGAELFVPNQTGQITQSARGTGNGGATTVNFNINTVDASGFEELLVRSRGTITQLINNAVNERGSKNLI